jgi:hypothetical protein
VFSGSLDFFSDEFFTADVELSGQTPVKSGNAALARALALWCFKETGVLKVPVFALINLDPRKRLNSAVFVALPVRN